MKKQFKIIISTLVLVLFGFTSLQAQQVNVTAKLDTLNMSIGQQQRLRLEVSQPKDMYVGFPVYDQTIIPKIEIVEAIPMDTIDLGDRISVVQDYLITSFDTGFYYFDPILFKLDEKFGGGQMETQPMVLKVFTLEVNDKEPIKAIKPPMDLKYEFREILPWILGGLLLVVIVVAIIWLFRQLMRKEPILPFAKPKPIEPPHVIALRELEALKEEKLWQTDRVKEFYTRLTDTLRVYIEGRYKVTALEQTSDEILASLKGELSDKDAAMSNLQQILSLADLVKFAKIKPLPNENDLCMMNGILFVEQTRQEEVKSIEEVKEEMESDDNEQNSTSEDENSKV